MNEQLITILEQLKDNFDYDNTTDYENLLLIIYNSLFLNEDSLVSSLKYKIFETISTIVHMIELHKQNVEFTIDKEKNLEILEQVYIPFYMHGGIHPASAQLRELKESEIKDSY